MSRATNDNFLHLTLARQWLAGDWPVLDFFDHGWLLQYTLSAASQIIFGDRLLSEAVIVGVTWGISVYLVFQIVRRVTGFIPAASLSALLLIVAGARGYSYPKGIVYAVAAALWWGYLRQPTTARIVGLGAWTAVAFYWRPDHGLYVAIAVTLAVLSAHGLRVISAVRCSLAGATTLLLVAPFLVYVHLTVGLPEYAQTGMVAAQVEHTTHGPHQWPLLRFYGTLFEIEPAEDYAPTINIRWTSASSPETRRQVLARYDLTPLTSDGDVSERVRLSERSIPNLGGLVNESIVDDTAGIERSTGALSSSSWPAWQRWRFRQAWLRVRVLPSLEGQVRASEYTVALFYALPILLLIAAPWMPRYLSSAPSVQGLVAFAAFAFLVDLAMLRSPFEARAPDAVVLSAIVFGFCVAWLWRAGGASGRLRGALIRICALALVLMVAMSVSGAGEFDNRLTLLAGEWTSARRAHDAWISVYDELVASPPLAYYRDQSARFSLRLAAYVRECVPPSERLLVLWFEPEIYYYSDRLMAQRHLAFAPAWAVLAHEQRMTIEKAMRFAPPIALARQSALNDYARATYPGLVDYVQREYHVAASVADDGEDYLIFARRDRPVARGFGPQNWPCFVRESSEWSRVGRSVRQ
jgi:hypothetical protein